MGLTGRLVLVAASMELLCRVVLVVVVIVTMSAVLYITLLERNQATLWNRPLLLLLLSSSSILATTGRIPSPSGLTRDMAQCHTNHLYFLYSLPNIYCNIPQYSIDYFTLWHFSEYSVTKFSEGSVFQVVILPCGTLFFLLCVSSSALNLAIYFWWTVPPFSSRFGIFSLMPAKIWYLQPRWVPVYSSMIVPGKKTRYIWIAFLLMVQLKQREEVHPSFRVDRQIDSRI